MIFTPLLTTPGHSSDYFHSWPQIATHRSHSSRSLRCVSNQINFGSRSGPRVRSAWHMDLDSVSSALWRWLCPACCRLRIRSVARLDWLSFSTIFGRITTTKGWVWIVLENNSPSLLSFQQLHYSHQYQISDAASQVHILHQEQRKGEHVTGSYAHLDPSGHIRSVHYEVRGPRRGFRAVIEQRTGNSRVHQALGARGSRQPTRALALAQPVAFVI